MPQVGGEDDYNNNNGGTGGNGAETGYGSDTYTTAPAAGATTAAPVADTTAAAADTTAAAAETTAAAAATTVAAADTTAAAAETTPAATTAAATTAAATTAADTTAAAATTAATPVCPIGSNACPGIDEVNSARGGHGTPTANFDATLTADAQAWADQLFADGVDPAASNAASWKDPSNDGSYGEIVWIAMTPPLSDPSVLGVAAAQTFYQQKDNFNHNSFECASGQSCDDYTQMMWASSTSMGVGIVQSCDPGQFLCTSYVVMRFTPAGNVAGEYPSNVLPATARFPGLMSPSSFLAAIMAKQS